MTRTYSMLRQLRSRTGAVMHDLLMVPVAWLGAYFLRFNLGSIPEEFWSTALSMMPVVFLIQASAFSYFGLYRGVWRFASLPDLIRIMKAVAAGALGTLAVIFLLTRMQDIPRSVFPLYGILLIGLLAGPRIIYRWYKDHKLYMGAPELTCVLVVGAGRAGEMLVREMLRSPARGFVPVGYVDDDPKKLGRDIHGVRVLGRIDEIESVAMGYGVDVVLIAMPSASGAMKRQIVHRCEESGRPFRILPPMEALVSGDAVWSRIREVSIEDLLGRDSVALDVSGMSAFLNGKRVLVTGAGGSIGSELCRNLVKFAPQELILLDHSEFNLFEISRELDSVVSGSSLKVLLADIGDSAAVDRILAETQPHVVFHAAAYKHVPMLEGQVREAVQNNVLGTATIARAAVRHGVGTFLLISTDKAVNPSNVMGATKRCAEIFCQNLNGQSDTNFITVRFGNVLGSAGSVIPIFKQQIAEGGPVTVTDREVTRFFMTIPEAAQLILQGAVMGDGGEIYVLEMGDPIKIRHLAEELIRLSGHTPDEDIEIRYVGLRFGEKLHEELFHDKESLVATEHHKILLARSRRVDWGWLSTQFSALEEAVGENADAQVVDVLKELVPEWSQSVVVVPEAGKVIPFERSRPVE